MPHSHALALRTSLLVDATAGAPPIATAADAVVFDLATAPAEGRSAAREAAKSAAPEVAKAGRDVHARVSPARSGELEADLLTTVGKHLRAVVLTGAEIPQDVRDADVGIRRYEMQLGIVPGSLRLIPEVDSAAGMSALAAILKAVDRHSAVALNTDGLRADLHLDGRSGPAIDHAMWGVALAAADAGLPWLVTAPAASTEERARLAARAREFGAAGSAVASEAEVRGLNALFTPSAEAVDEARTVVEVAGRKRRRGASEIDRRTLRRAHALLARAEAIERRERAR